jgi:hypothetical protein
MIDVKRLLYKYRKLEVKLGNIQNSIDRLNNRYPSGTQRISDEPMARGGLISSQTERFALYNVFEIEVKREDLRQDLRHCEEAVNLVRNALNTLNQRQRDLIDFRYFQDREPAIVANMLNVSMNQFWKLHKIAYEGVEECLNNGKMEISDNYFIPQKDKKKEPIQVLIPA